MANKRTTTQSRQAKVEIVGSSVFGIYPKINIQKTYNSFISDEFLIQFPGYKRVQQFVTGNLGSGRGIFYSTRGNFMLVVIDSIVYRVNPNLGFIQIGSLNTSSGEVFMDENLNNQVAIVDGLFAYIYYHPGAAVLTVQTVNVSLLPNYVAYHNTFFLFGNAFRSGDGAKWYAYEYASATTISEVTELALQTKPDYAIAVKRIPGQGNNVLVFGRTVCEIWTQVGGIQNYRRNSTINVDYGCISISTIAASDQYLTWLGANEDNAPVIMVYSGQGVSPISTDGIDHLLARIKYPDQSTAMMYRQEGHLFYQLTFFNKKDNLSLIYDFTTKKFFNLSDAYLNYHPARQIVYFNNAQYFVSLNNASLYQQSLDFTTYNENISGSNANNIHEIPCIRICNTIRSSNTSRFRVNSFVMLVEQGCDPEYTQLNTDYACGDPIVMENDITDIIFSEDGQEIVMEGGMPCIPYRPRIDLSFSKDGGETWSNYVARNLNPIGKRKNILQWENMGAANEFTIKLRYNSRSRKIMASGEVDLF